jgi:hypothetical protein
MIYSLLGNGVEKFDAAIVVLCSDGDTPSCGWFRPDCLLSARQGGRQPAADQLPPMNNLYLYDSVATPQLFCLRRGSPASLTSDVSRSRLWLYRRRVQESDPYLSRAICWAASRMDAGKAADTTIAARILPNSVDKADANLGAVISIPVKSQYPGSSGAAGDRAKSRLPCCRIAPRCRRWALPTTFQFCPADVGSAEVDGGVSTTSPAARRWKQRKGSAAEVGREERGGQWIASVQAESIFVSGRRIASWTAE